MYRAKYVINIMFAFFWVLLALVAIDSQRSYAPVGNLIKMSVYYIFIVLVFVFTALSFKFKNREYLRKLALLSNVLLISALVMFSVYYVIVHFDMTPGNKFVEAFVIQFVLNFLLLILPAAINIKGLRCIS